VRGFERFAMDRGGALRLPRVNATRRPTSRLTLIVARHHMAGNVFQLLENTIDRGPDAASRR
jgi:hypothetical protein